MSKETSDAPVTLDEIEAAAKEYRAIFDRAEKLKAAVEREQQAVLNSYAKVLDALAVDLSDANVALSSLLLNGREHFRRPKTQTFHRVVVGFAKGRDRVVKPEDEVLFPRIERLLKDKASTLIHTVKSIVAEAFKRLPKSDLQMLGCEVVSGADEVVIRPESSSDVEKYFRARLAAAETINHQP
jgi:hypothetical protein